MEKPVLTDPAIFPSNKVLFSHLGKAKPAFVSLFEFGHKNFPDLVKRWKYYNDGKRWLLNVSRKKKTVFWLSVYDGCFRISCYFNSKAEETILKSRISRRLKNQFLKSAGEKFHAISLVLKTKKDIEACKELLKLKVSVM